MTNIATQRQYVDALDGFITTWIKISWRGDGRSVVNYKNAGNEAVGVEFPIKSRQEQRKSLPIIVERHQYNQVVEAVCGRIHWNRNLNERLRNSLAGFSVPKVSWDLFIEYWKSQISSSVPYCSKETKFCGGLFDDTMVGRRTRVRKANETVSRCPWKTRRGISCCHWPSVVSSSQSK